MLPLFGIRELRPTEGLDDFGLIRIRHDEYNELVSTNPTGALSYTDEEDGEKITVGSSLELSQRLQESIPLPSMQNSESSSSVSKPFHVFDVNRSEPVLSVWRGYDERTRKDYLLPESRTQDAVRRRHFRSSNPPDLRLDTNVSNTAQGLKHDDAEHKSLSDIAEVSQIQSSGEAARSKSLTPEGKRMAMAAGSKLRGQVHHQSFSAFPFPLPRCRHSVPYIGDEAGTTREAATGIVTDSKTLRQVQATDTPQCQLCKAHKDRWATYAASPPTFAPRDWPKSVKSAIQSADKGKGPAAKRDDQPLLDMFEAELAKLGKFQPKVKSTTAQPDPTELNGPSPEVPKPVSTEKQTVEDEPRALKETIEEPALKPEAPQEPGSRPDDIPNEKSDENVPRSKPNVPNPGEILVASLKSLGDGLGVLASAMKQTVPEVQHHLVAAHHAVPNQIEKALRTSITSLKNVLEQIDPKFGRRQVKKPAKDTVSALPLGLGPGNEVALTDRPFELSEAPPVPEKDVAFHHGTDTPLSLKNFDQPVYIGNALAQQNKCSKVHRVAEHTDYKVKELVGRRFISYGFPGGPQYKQYLVRWCGCGSEEDTWYDVENLKDCAELVRAYEWENYTKHYSLDNPLPNEYRLHASNMHVRTATNPMMAFKGDDTSLHAEEDHRRTDSEPYNELRHAFANYHVATLQRETISSSQPSTSKTEGERAKSSARRRARFEDGNDVEAVLRPRHRLNELKMSLALPDEQGQSQGRGAERPEHIRKRELRHRKSWHPASSSLGFEQLDLATSVKPWMPHETAQHRHSLLKEFRRSKRTNAGVAISVDNPVTGYLPSDIKPRNQLRRAQSARQALRKTALDAKPDAVPDMRTDISNAKDKATRSPTIASDSDRGLPDCYDSLYGASPPDPHRLRSPPPFPPYLTNSMSRNSSELHDYATRQLSLPRLPPSEPLYPDPLLDPAYNRPAPPPLLPGPWYHLPFASPNTASTAFGSSHELITNSIQPHVQPTLAYCPPPPPLGPSSSTALSLRTNQAKHTAGDGPNNTAASIPSSWSLFGSKGTRLRPVSPEEKALPKFGSAEDSPPAVSTLNITAVSGGSPESQQRQGASAPENPTGLLNNARALTEGERIPPQGMTNAKAASIELEPKSWTFETQLPREHTSSRFAVDQRQSKHIGMPSPSLNRPTMSANRPVSGASEPQPPTAQDRTWAKVAAGEQGRSTSRYSPKKPSTDELASFTGKPWRVDGSSPTLATPLLPDKPWSPPSNRASPSEDIWQPVGRAHEATYPEDLRISSCATLLAGMGYELPRSQLLDMSRAANGEVNVALDMLEEDRLARSRRVVESRVPGSWNYYDDYVSGRIPGSMPPP